MVTAHRRSTVDQLGRALFDARHDVARIFQALASTLTVTLCDGCSIVLDPSTLDMRPITSYRVDACDAVAGHEQVLQLPLSRLTRLVGLVTVTRASGSPALDDDDIAAIASCIEHASLAAESALQLVAERAAVRDERVRTMQFQQEMLGIVGHDLKAPIGAILLGTELLATGERPEPPPVVTRIASFANRMTRMVDQLLDLTRVRLGGSIPLSRTRGRLEPIVRSVIAELRVVHPHSSIELTADAEVRGCWDADRVAQVVFDLVGNAVQFGREEAPIQVGVSHAPGAARITVSNEVRDQPMSAELIARLFEPYRRGWDSDHSGTGLGLGLYIAHEIVRAHRGSIAVVSSPSGTIFEVLLPDTEQADG